MGTVQGKRTVFSTHLCIGGQQWLTQSQPRCFQSEAQRQPCCLHLWSAPAHLPLSRPFCWSRTYLQRSLQEEMSQDESFMLDISGYIRERLQKYSLRESQENVQCSLFVWSTDLHWMRFAAWGMKTTTNIVVGESLMARLGLIAFQLTCSRPQQQQLHQ